MFATESAGEIGNVLIHKVDHRGFNPEELAEQALNRIIYVGDQSHPAIRDQAQAFREHIRGVLVFYMTTAWTMIICINISLILLIVSIKHKDSMVTRPKRIVKKSPVKKPIRK